jgi:hypothetical protein
MTSNFILLWIRLFVDLVIWAAARVAGLFQKILRKIGENTWQNKNRPYLCTRSGKEGF